MHNRRVLGATALVATVLGALLFSFARPPAGSKAAVTSRPGPTAAVASAFDKPAARVAASAAVRREPSVDDLASAGLEKLAGRIRTALESSAAYARYRDCVKRGESNCEDLWSGAMFSVLNTVLDEDQATVAASDLLKETSDAAFLRAVNAQLQSDDPVRRVTTLALLNGNQHLKGIPLEAAAYDDIKDKTVVEAYLLLRRHENVPVPDAECARKVSDLALDRSIDSRERIAALGALGNQRDSELLANTLTRLLNENDRDVVDDNPSLVGVLHRCGAPCAPVAERISRDSRSAIRTLGDDESGSREAKERRN